ncbi:MAG TPA: hypothetical protein VF796_28220 [Humisphaera sp.]
MAERDRAETDAYIVARFAEWAGDLAYSRTLYAKVGRGEQYRLFPEKFDGPTDVIGFVSSLRAARLGEPTFEQSRALASKVFAVEREDEKSTVVEPLPLRPTANLRAVVHRVGVRDFEMRAYLSNPDYERRLFAMATKLGARQTASADQGEATATKGAYVSPGGEWVIEGVLFQQVAVSDFGLIKSDGRWTKEEPPRDAGEVLAPFQKLLDALDPSVAAANVQGGQ